MSTEQSSPHRYVLRPRPPVRAFVVAAVLVLAGALLLALVGRAAPWSALALLVVVLGLALAGLAASSMVRMRTFVDLDDEGLRIHGPGVDKREEWAEITKVTTSQDGSHLTFHHGQVGRTHVICPGGSADEQMTALVADVARHLDASRGYGETINVPLIDPHRPLGEQGVTHQS